jgi:hypothetical protein
MKDKHDKKITFSLRPTVSCLPLVHKNLAETTQQILLRCKEKKLQVLSEESISKGIAVKLDATEMTRIPVVCPMRGSDVSLKKPISRKSLKLCERTEPVIYISNERSRFTSKTDEESSTVAHSCGVHSSEQLPTKPATVSQTLYMNLTQKLFSMNVKYSKTPQAYTLEERRAEQHRALENTYFYSNTPEDSGLIPEEETLIQVSESHSTRYRASQLPSIYSARQNLLGRETDRNSRPAEEHFTSSQKESGSCLDRKVTEFLNNIGEDKLRGLTGRYRIFDTQTT